MLASLLALIVGTLSATTNAPAKGHPIIIPTHFVENMVYARPVTRKGITLNFYTDSGGGILIYRGVVNRLHLHVIPRKLDGKQMEEVHLPEFQPGKEIPPPLGHDSKLIVVPDKTRLEPRLSGLLGQEWFAERVWTWDYPGHRLLWRAEGDLPDIPAEHRVALGFPTDKKGERYPSLSFARIQATVDGEVIDLLFDTGANTVLSDSAVAAVHDGHGAHRATSFIVESILKLWHTKHPDWRFIEHGEKGSGHAMIEVPSLTVAGYQTGPVWFTARPDGNLEQWMSQWMDKKVYGALGGSALYGFRITVDYPNATAYFERPK
jgi:hypothetical protein